MGGFEEVGKLMAKVSAPGILSVCIFWGYGFGRWYFVLMILRWEAWNGEEASDVVCVCVDEGLFSLK